MNLQTNFDD